MANAQLDIKLIRNRLGGHNLAHNGFMYRTRFSPGERTYWRFTIFTCPATLNTRNNNITGLGQYPHNHPADQANIASKEIMNFISDRCQNEIVQKLPTFYSSKSTLYRARRKQTPKLPASPIDIQLDGKWTETSTGECFLLFDDTQQQQRIIAFAATENLTDLSASDRIYCDGTFYTCHSVFHQIYTIHMQE